MRLNPAYRTVLVHYQLSCELKKACLSLYTLLLKMASRNMFVVTTAVNLMRLDRKTRHFCYLLGFGSQPQVFSHGVHRDECADIRGGMEGVGHYSMVQHACL